MIQDPFFLFVSRSIVKGVSHLLQSFDDVMSVALFVRRELRSLRCQVVIYVGHYCSLRVRVIAKPGLETAAQAAHSLLPLRTHGVLDVQSAV